MKINKCPVSYTKLKPLYLSQDDFCKIVIARPESYKGGLKIMIYDRYKENEFRLPFEWPSVKKQIQNGVRVNETIKQIIDKLDELKPKIDAALDKGEPILK